MLILGVLLWKGFGGLSLGVFTQMTPPPGSRRRPAQRDRRQPDDDRRSRSPIGTPIGILAGTYMAEYGRYDSSPSVVRFINDILLTAPSIVIGLFVYEVMVAQMGHFSGWAGAVALARDRRSRWSCAPPRTCCILVPEHAARGRGRARRCRAR